MKTINLPGETGLSRIIVGESFGNLSRYCRNSRTFIITDSRVNRIYGKDFPSSAVIEIEPGEEVKTISTVEYIYRRLIAMGADRSSLVVGIGGGVVSDITGFAASTFLRGVNFGFVPSTLLSQVDAAIGGKNGINVNSYKNMAGVFNQPVFVLCDPGMLDTLPAGEMANGFAEAIKSALIGDPELFEFMAATDSRSIAGNRDAMERVIYDSAAVKAGIVERDEKESGIRKVLNFGHTLGHAFEKTTHLTHGESVSAGMVMAARFSVARGLLNRSMVKRLTGLLRKYRLPVNIPFPPARLMDAVRKDKKRDGDAIDFVFIKDIGVPVVEKVDISWVEEAVYDMRKSG